MGTLTTISRYVNSAFRAAGLAAVVALSGCSNGSSTPPPPPGGTLEEKGINLTPDTSEVVTEMDEGGEEISYAKDKVLVQVAAGTKNADLETLLQQVNGQITGHIQPLNWYEIQVQDAKTALPAIRQHPLVQNAELNYAGVNEELDIDSSQWSGVAWGYHKIKLSEAYGFIGDKSLDNVTVAVLDSGFDLEHPELASQFLPGVDVGSVDDNPTYEDIPENLSKAREHGTSVAGIIAMLNNGKALNGVAYNANLLPVKISASSALGKAAEGAAMNTVLAFKLAAGIVYAALEEADVINMSVGWSASSPSLVLSSAVGYAQAQDISLIASAGNENKDAAKHYPSKFEGVISVGATTEGDERWMTESENDGSNYSSANNLEILTVAAPGRSIMSAQAGSRGEFPLTDESGTSLAAPFVSGLDALIKSLKSSLSAEERRQIIIDSADEIKVAYPEADLPRNKTWKRINAYNAVVLAETGCNPGKQMCGGTGNKCEGESVEVSLEWTVLGQEGIGADITIDLEGNIYVIGTSGEIPNEGLNILINKYNSDGTPLWNSPILYDGPASDDDWGTGIAMDSVGNIYAVGDELVPGESYNIWINKYSSNGTPLWSSPISYNGGSASKSDHAKDIAVDSTGNIYVIGNEAVSGEGWNIWINKYSSNGGQLWSNPQSYNTPMVNENDYGTSITLDTSGNVLVSGISSSLEESVNIWVNKYNSNGSPLWNNPITYNGSADDWDRAFDITTDPAGNIYVVGDETVSEGYNNLWINKYSPNGIPLWNSPVSYNGPVGGEDTGAGIAIDTEENIYVTGNTDALGGSNLLINKYNSSGLPLWSSPIFYLGPRDWAGGSKITVDPNGNIYVIGYVVPPEENSWRVLIQKYSQCQ